MVDDAQNYWVFGLFPSSGILGNRWHDVSETGSVCVFLSVLKTETDTVSETSGHLLPRIPDDGKSPKPSNSVCHPPLSEPSRIYIFKMWFTSYGLLLSCMYGRIYFGLSLNCNPYSASGYLLPHSRVQLHLLTSSNDSSAFLISLQLNLTVDQTLHHTAMCLRFVCSLHFSICW
jgi:hypothetical protein